MAAENFAASLARVLRDEGGYSNDRADPGGATMWGITHIDYDAYRKHRGLALQDVRKMTPGERDEIYRQKYWSGARCDDLPAGVDYVVFDGAVNSGVAQSVKWLQRAIGGDVVVDGHIGDVTVTAANEADPDQLVRSICDQRMRFLQSLRTFKVFGKGWTRRVNGVEAIALGQVDRGEHPAGSSPDGGAKAKIVDQADPLVSQGSATVGTTATAAGASVVQQIQSTLAPYSDTLSAIKYALIAAAVVGLAITIYTMWRSNQVKAVS